MAAGSTVPQILRPETVALMDENHIASSRRRRAEDREPAHDQRSRPVSRAARQAGASSFLINLEDAPTGRSAGSLTWAGMGNTYFWLDPKRQVAGVLLTQILPFADPIVLRLLERFETAVYRAVDGS